MRLIGLLAILSLLTTVTFGQDRRQAGSPTTPVTGSLFNPTTSQNFSQLISDNIARNVGDIVTIRVLESTQSTINASSGSSRESDISFGVPNAAGLGGQFILPHLPGAVPGRILRGTGSATFDGEGSVERSSEFSTTIAGRVIEVLPNGDLVIEARKEVEVNREKQMMTLSGIVRTADINRNNVIASSNIAELRVHLTGKGFVADANKPGWLFRFLQKILPF